MKVLKKAATYSSTVVVPSAQTGLTSLFGKVRGEPRRYNHLKLFRLFKPYNITYWKKNMIVVLIKRAAYNKPMGY